VWQIEPESWRELAGPLAGRNLTQEEWETCLLGYEYRKTCGLWPAGE
jgi:hypothetical protein